MTSSTAEILFPRYFTPALSEGFTTAGPRLLKLFNAFWRDPQTGKALTLESWQEWLLCRVLETYPEGHPLEGQLRYRQVVIVLPRQSGKSLIAAALTLKFLFDHALTPIVVGTAGRNAQQAGIVFNRLKQTIVSVPALKKEFKRVTSTRGMELKNGGTYTLYPAKGDSVQGIDLTAAILDELHLAKESLWAALEYGQRAQDMSMVVAITTAGDENSTLLSGLTDTGRDLSEHPDPESRFGFFEWSCPPEIPWDSPEAVLSCNPRVVSGSIPLERIIASQRTTLKAEYCRYTLNLTTQSKSTWIDLSDWDYCMRQWPELPVKATVAATEISPGSTYATVTLAGVDDLGLVHTHLLCSIPNPSTSHLADVLSQVAREYEGITLAADSLSGKELAVRLKGLGFKPRLVSLGDVAEATTWAHDAIQRHALTHCGTKLLNRQARTARAKVLPRGGYRLVPQIHGQIDALQSFVIASWLANKLKDEQPAELMYVF